MFDLKVAEARVTKVPEVFCAQVVPAIPHAAFQQLCSSHLNSPKNDIRVELHHALPNGLRRLYFAISFGRNTPLRGGPLRFNVDSQEHPTLSFFN
jgi:hypothetical protein